MSVIRPGWGPGGRWHCGERYNQLAFYNTLANQCPPLSDDRVFRVVRSATPLYSSGTREDAAPDMTTKIAYPLRTNALIVAQVFPHERPIGEIRYLPTAAGTMKVSA